MAAAKTELPPLQFGGEWPEGWTRIDSPERCATVMTRDPVPKIQIGFEPTALESSMAAVEGALKTLVKGEAA
jgi:hypothetical protein